MAAIGNLVVDLRADIAQFDRNMKKANRQLNSTAARMNKNLARMERGFTRVRQQAVSMFGAFLGAQGIGALNRMARQSIRTADEIDKVADVIGFTTAQLQQLRFAGEQTNVAISSVDMALQRFSRRVAEVAQGEGELLKTAQQYNVQLRDSDGRMKSNIRLLKDFADIIANAESEQEQLRIAFKLFDSEGARFVNVMRQGSDGIDRFIARANEMGVVLNRELIDKGAEANSEIQALSRQIDSNLTQTFINLAPAIKGATAELVGLTQLISDLSGTPRNVGEFETIDALDAEIRRIQERIRALKVDMNTFGGEFTLGPFSPGGQGVAEINALRATVDLLRERRREIEAMRGLAPIRPNVTPRGPAPIAPIGVSGFEPRTGDRMRRVNEVIGEMQRIEDAWDASQGNIAAVTFRQTERQARAFEDMAEAIGVSQEKIADKQLMLWGAAFEKTANRFEKMEGTTTEGLENISDEARAAGQALETAFQNAIFDASNLSDVLDALWKRLGSIVLFGAGGQGGIFGGFLNDIGGQLAGLFTPRAAGGPVEPGRGYLVGEKGPELFVPRMAGNIVPNDGLSGGGSFVVNFNFAGPVDERAMRASGAQVARKLARVVNRGQSGL